MQSFTMPPKKKSKSDKARKTVEEQRMADIPDFMKTENVNELFSQCKTDASIESLARRLYKKFDAIVFDGKLSKWVVPIKMVRDDTSDLIGLTNSCWSKFYLKSEILLNLALITTGEQLRDTVIHECCHVAQFLIDRYTGEEDHGKEWLKWTEKANRLMPELNKITDFEIYYSS